MKLADNAVNLLTSYESRAFVLSVGALVPRTPQKIFLVKIDAYVIPAAVAAV